MGGIKKKHNYKTNWEYIKEMDENNFAVFLSDFNVNDLDPLDIKIWLEKPYIGDRVHMTADGGFVGDFEGIAKDYITAYEMEISFLENLDE